ncbi:enoyl-CoA hydratase-related protein [Bradyrhizobium sp. Ash2021]|uniref:enoyl-CoA hydratase/isomerase family protein n=1 Tax=Bradyrhizobium sp. Ash2021 TaxID=2954771 RepID=UPI00281536BA|nr:enoyl-CoA hydratase-related protein [Bradyrhizobium sp. Ash2021]WMT77108.1 enoyl-CoA hydratase-related protein [Bradyrhizobium sp. Ash2021]
MQKVLVENYTDGTTLITINRPERRNAICAETALMLQKAFVDFERSPTQKAAVVTGAGNEAFSGGADTGNFPELWRCIPTVGFETTKPIVSAVGGWCVGGALVLSMMCDLTVAAENAKFSYPEARLGFTGGLIAGLAARIPHKIAMEMMLLCRVLDPQRGYAIGLVNEVVPAGQQVPVALKMAREMAEFSPLVLKTLKRFVTEGVLAQGPSEQSGRAQRTLHEVKESEDAEEARLAVKEKRKAAFKGR